MKDKKTLIFLTLLIVIFVSLFSYTFDPKLHIGGDDSNYYIYATSMTEGHGYADISSPEMRPTSTFPPGYPMLMTPLRFVTDSIVAQKTLNGLFLLASAILMFFFAKRALGDIKLGFLAGVVMTLNYRVLEFSSMMMSEMAAVMFSVFVIILAAKLIESTNKKWWREPWIYLLILSAGYSFLIRTQGVSLVVAVVVALLFARKWIETVAFAGGFYLISSLWSLRNSAVGLGSSRYLDQIVMSNMWRPEDGTLSFGEIITRGFETLQMLLTKAIPSTIMPYLTVDYTASSTLGEWITAIILIALIIIGFRQFKSVWILLISYVVFTLGLICLWSAPSENRYITAIVPLLEIGLVVGAYTVIVSVIKKTISPMWMFIPLVIFVSPMLKMQHQIASSEHHPAYANFFRMGEAIKGKIPKNSVVCSRKPQLFYMYSAVFGRNYKYSLDDREVIATMVEGGVDYVVLEQLGYASTARYLYPAIMNNQELFTPVMQLPAPDTYLLKFDREAAAKKIGR